MKQLGWFISYLSILLIFFRVSHFFLDNFRFDRDWKKIEAFVGSKTVIQVITMEAKEKQRTCY